MNQFLKKGLVLATAALSIGYQAKADKGRSLLKADPHRGFVSVTASF